MTIREEILLSGGEVHVLPSAEATSPHDLAMLAQSPANDALVERLVDGVAGMRAQSTREARKRSGFGSSLSSIMHDVAIALHMGPHSSHT